MKYKPHPYQTQATQHIIQNPKSVLMLEMGLGKTVTTLTALTHLYATQQARKTLIIAPLRVAQNVWPTEIQKWEHTKHLSFTLISGSPVRRLRQLSEQTQIHIINRENIPWLTQTLGNTWDYDTLIIDELSSFKNPSAKRFKHLAKHTPNTPRIIGLTGTPAPNSLLDLWAQYKLIDSGKTLGKNLTHYRAAYFHPATWVYGRPVGWRLNTGADKHIYARIKPITLSMQTKDHLQLPAITYTKTYTHINPATQHIYDKLKNEYITEINNTLIDTPTVAGLSNKLMQLANGAIYTPTREILDVHDAKLEALEDVIEQTNSQPLLVAYWFKHDAARIQARHPNARILQTSEDFQDWNAQQIPLALIHPASAGHGLNLQAGGHYLCWFSLCWSLELYQ